MTMGRKNESKHSDSEDNFTFSDASDIPSEEDELTQKSNLFDDSGDDDSAPEEVTFKDEKEKFTLSKKRTAVHLKQQKDQLKKKRRELHVRNALQKEEKLKRLGEKMPPAVQEFLSILSKVDASNAKPEKTVFANESEEEQDKLEEIVESKKQEKEFIELHGSTVFRVKNIKKEAQKLNPRAVEVVNFREKALFGKRIRREPTQKLFAKLEKQKVGGKR